MLYFQMWRKERERERERVEMGWYRPCLLSFLWFIGRNIFYSSSWNISKDKTKIFSHCFQAVVMWWWEAGDDGVILVRTSSQPVLWCPPAWRGTTPAPRSTRPLSTATKVRMSWPAFTRPSSQPLCVQVTPGRRAGEEFSTSQLTTSNCRARDLRQRDTTTTIIGEAAVTRRNMSGNPHLSSSVMANLRPSCRVLIPAERS